MTGRKAGEHVYFDADGVQLLVGNAVDVLQTLPPGSIDAVVTSPPYWGLRDYGHPDQIGLEATPEAYVEALVQIFAQVHRVLKRSATVWLNLGDSYACGPAGSRVNNGHLNGRPNAVTTPAGFGGKRGLPAKNLAGIPWRVALALQATGRYILRNAIIWSKPNAMPQSVRDRFTGKYEIIFLLTVSPRYYFNLDAVRQPYTGQRPLSRRAHKSGRKPYTIRTAWPPPETKHADPAAAPPGHDVQQINIVGPSVHPDGANPGDVWTIATRPYKGAHFAVFPIDIPLRCLRAGCPPGGVVLDPFSGAGTTLLAARKLGMPAIGIDLRADFHQLTLERLAEEA